MEFSGYIMRQEQTAASLKKFSLPLYARLLIGWVVLMGAAAVLMYCWRVVFSLEALPAIPATAAVMGVFSLLYAAVVALCFLKGDKFCLKAALVIFLAGLLFCFAVAPMQVPDEATHYLRAVSMSMGDFSYNYAASYPEDVRALMAAFPPYMNHEVLYSGGQLAPAAFSQYDALVASGSADAVASPIMFMWLPFLPQALFMWVVRLFGGSAMALMYAGRIANLLVYAVGCYFALRGCKRYRSVFLVLMLLPLSLFMAASCSYDSLMLTGCFFLLSYFCRDEIHLRHLVVFGLVLAFCTYIKPMNIILGAVLFFVPRERWRLRYNPKLLIFAVLTFAFAAWYIGGNIDLLLRTGGWPQALPRGGGEGAEPAAQLAFVFSNIPRFFAVTLQSVYEADGFLFSLATFGWTDMHIPLVGGLSLCSLFLGSAMGIGRRERTKSAVLIGLACVMLLYAASILAGMYVLDTDLMSIRISGLQSRYFLPAFLLLFLCVSILLGKTLAPRSALPAADARRQGIALWAGAGVAAFSAVLIFQNTFIGQWIPKAEGGFKLINMFGWAVT